MSQAKPGKVGIFTMTRDRLDFTKKSLPSMWTKAGAKYDYWVFDQGSTDGTLKWLNAAHEAGNIDHIVELGENKGLHIGMNTAHETLLDAGYSYIVKVDNDIKFKTAYWLKKLLRAYHSLAKGSVVAPRIENLQFPPVPFATKRIGGFRMHFLDIIGGQVRLMPRASIEDFRFNERMPLAWGGDATFANHCEKNSIPMVRADDIIAKHMMTDPEQTEHSPTYMKRRVFEAYIPYGV